MGSSAEIYYKNTLVEKEIEHTIFFIFNSCTKDWNLRETIFLNTSFSKKLRNLVA